MCEPNEHSQMLAFIGKATFPKEAGPQAKPAPLEGPTFSTPEELGKFLADFISKMARNPGTHAPVLTRPTLRTWCRNCGHAAHECVGHEDCYGFTPEEYAASMAEEVQGLCPLPPGHAAYDQAQAALDESLYGSPF